MKASPRVAQSLMDRTVAPAVLRIQVVELEGRSFWVIGLVLTPRMASSVSRAWRQAADRVSPAARHPYFRGRAVAPAALGIQVVELDGRSLGHRTRAYALHGIDHVACFAPGC